MCEKDEAERAMLLDAENELAKLVDDEKSPSVGVVEVALEAPEVAAASEVWCFCDMPEKDYNEDHPMVFCQGSTCKRKWFHFSCIGKATNWSAEGDYYCPSC